VAETEPRPTDERLADVRPDTRPTADHAGHDRWLVVRWTSDPADLSPDEVGQARALLAACTECARLSSDLALITRATASSIVPPRPRDFRITPQQAAKAKGSLLERARRWLGSPGSAAVRPLAGAAVTMGLVLLLVAPNLQPPSPRPADDSQGISAPEATTVLKATPAAPDGTDGAGAAEMYLAGTDDPSLQAQMRVGESPDPAAGDTAVRETATDPPEPPVADAPGDADRTRTGGDADRNVDDTTFALTLLGIVLAGVGLMVLMLSWLARRWQDPLLR
jgi:hypothetical protein